MANEHVNKVVYDGRTLIDLTPVTVSADKLASGYTALDASGALITGALDPNQGSAYQDADGYVVLDEGESTTPQGTLAITANGSYDVADYAGATVDVGGMSEEDLKKRIQSPGSLYNIDWPDGITSIASYAFVYVSLSKVESLPSTLTKIGEHAFDNSSIAVTSLPDGITRIESNAFYGANKLALTRLPTSLTYIGAGAFYVCKNISITEIPSSVTYIGNNAFCYCISIPSISCDGAIATLGTNAFTGSTNNQMILASASFPNMALTSNIDTVFGSTIVDRACQQLEFCDIGSTVGIATNAFANCYALETLVLRRSDAICTLANVSAFTNTPMRGYNSLTGMVYVPSALIESYKAATNWSTLYNDGTVTFAAIEGSEYERD